MLNEHDITKKMLNLIREATMSSNNQSMEQDINKPNEEGNQIKNGNKIYSFESVILQFKMSDIIYTFDSNLDEISTNTGSDEVLTSVEDADDIKKLDAYFNTTWKPNWFNNRVNEVKKEKSNEEINIVSNGIKNPDYGIFYDEDLKALQTINKGKNVEIIEYKFKLK
jgi:hypothetical protein